MQIFSVTLGKKKFEIVGIADLVKKQARFQAIVNDIPFAQSEDYEVARQLLMDAIQLNQPEKQEGVQ